MQCQFSSNANLVSKNEKQLNGWHEFISKQSSCITRLTRLTCMTGL